MWQRQGERLVPGRFRYTPPTDRCFVALVRPRLRRYRPCRRVQTWQSLSAATDEPPSLWLTDAANPQVQQTLVLAGQGRSGEREGPRPEWMLDSASLARVDRVLTAAPDTLPEPWPRDGCPISVDSFVFQKPIRCESPTRRTRFRKRAVGWGFPVWSGVPKSRVDRDRDRRPSVPSSSRLRQYPLRRLDDTQRPDGAR